MKRPAIAVVLVFLGGCSGTQSVLNPAGEQSSALLMFFELTLAICGVMYLLVVGFLVLSVRRVRRGGGDAPPCVAPSDRGLDRSLVMWGATIVSGLTLLITASFALDRRLAAARSSESLLVRVTAQQWWWRIQYRDPQSGAWIETANEFHLPIGKTAKIELGSNDVIHSFWIPNIAGKMDVIPGRINTTDLSPTRLGWFRGQCFEFCGQQHAHMALDVKVESEADFEAWLGGQARAAERPADSLAARGLQIVESQCSACHSIRGTRASGRAGPDLTHLADRRRIAAGTLALTRGDLQGWILQPQALKPGTLMPATVLDPRDADAVSHYLLSLK
jgi:cytochrome c oxidase subunit 2